MDPLRVGRAMSITNSRPSSLSSSVRIDSLKSLNCSSALNFGVFESLREFALLLLEYWELARANRIGYVEDPNLPRSVDTG